MRNVLCVDESAMTPAAELDSFLVRLCLWREARSESLAAKAGVLAVIRNRANDPKNRWPKTLAEVVLQRSQFTSFSKGDPNSVAFPRAPKTGTSPDWAAWLDSCAVWDAPLTADPTSGSQYYFDESADPNNVAKQWLGAGKTGEDLLKFKTCQIGRLMFFRID